MAPSKKVAESPSGGADVLTHRPSLDDEAFVEQLLRVAQCAANGTATTAAASVRFDEIYPAIVKRLTQATITTAVPGQHGQGSNSSVANSLDTSTLAALGQPASTAAVGAGQGNAKTVQVVPPSSQDGSVAAPPSVENVSFSGGNASEVINASFSRTGLGAEEVTLSQETIVLHLTSLLARALNAEDYWTNLLHQIRVDHYVWAIRYCASHSFSALKTLHVLQWLRGFQALLEQRTHTRRGEKEGQGSQAGGPQQQRYSYNEEGEGATTVQAGAGGHAAARAEAAEDSAAAAGSKGNGGRRGSAMSNTSFSSRTNATRKSAAGNGRRSRAGGRRESDTASAAAAVAAAAAAPLSPHRDTRTESDAQCSSQASYEAQLYAAMKDFLLGELQEGWRWEQAARDLAQGRDLNQMNAAGGNTGNGLGAEDGAGQGHNSGGGTPVTANLPGPTNTSSSSTSRKLPRGEKARQQQLEEQEEEQRRLALLAVLPRENIYLTRDEVVPFCEFFLSQGMLPHAALYRYVAHHDRPSRPVIHLSDDGSTCEEKEREKGADDTTPSDHTSKVFHVSVEVPMSVPPLADAVLREVNTAAGESAAAGAGHEAAGAASAAQHEGSGSGAKAAGHGNTSSKAGAQAGKGGTTAAAAQRAEKGRANESLPRRSPRGSGAAAATVVTIHEKAEEHKSPGSPRHTNPGAMSSAASPSPPPPLMLQSGAAQASALAALRAMQAEEEDRLTREHHAACAAAELAATTARREAEMQLHFAQEGTQRAVQDVYTSLEEDVTRRQMRVMQRVEALEKTLGISTGGSNEGGAAGEAGGSEAGAAAAAAAATTGTAGAKAKRPPTTTQKKGKK